MIVGIDIRRLAVAGLLILLAACTTAKIEDTQPPPSSGATNEAAPGFANVAPGSEEDFILNVGRRVFFTKGSADLDSVAKATLDAQAAWLQKYPSWLIKLQGFADDGGSDSGQIALSKKRAETVMAYLAAGGVASNRMWAKGYGKDREVRDCPQKACQVQNRRVVSNLRNERDT
jgi:peptidoglycan-associated lipoprotein